MCCERCDGLMVLDRLVDLRSSELWLSAWRCANCGNVVDDQIRRHRVEPPTLRRGRHASHNGSPIISSDPCSATATRDGAIPELIPP